MPLLLAFGVIWFPVGFLIPPKSVGFLFWFSVLVSFGLLSFPWASSCFPSVLFDFPQASSLLPLCLDLMVYLLHVGFLFTSFWFPLGCPCLIWSSFGFIFASHTLGSSWIPFSIFWG